MRIVQIVPGSGDTFYCQNCVRDLALVKALRAQGHDVIVAPMYLPLFEEEPGIARDSPVFFGGLNVYLQQRVPLFRITPRWLDRALDSTWLLRQVARKSSSVQAAGLESMTLSMLRGEQGKQRKEVQRLLAWLRTIQPDVVHLSNALLMGIVPSIKRTLRIPIVCSLQDEDGWVNAMRPPYAQQCWTLLAERALDVDAFVAVSRFYANTVRKPLNVPAARMHVVPIGLDVDQKPVAPLDFDPPAIGFLSRMTPASGLDVLVDAFIELRSDSRFSNVQLRATGGMVGRDQTFVAGLKKKLARHNLANAADFADSFEPKDRFAFLASLSLLSVPAPEGEAFGLYVLEALASGVPVVQPRTEAVTELVEATQGGILYEPGDAKEPATALMSLLSEPARARDMGRMARQGVRRDFNTAIMADRMAAVYAQCRTDSVPQRQPRGIRAPAEENHSPNNRRSAQNSRRPTRSTPSRP